MLANFDDGWETCSERSVSGEISVDEKDNSVLLVKDTAASNRILRHSPKIIHSNEGGISKIQIFTQHSPVPKNNQSSPKNHEKNSPEKSSSTDKSSDKTYTPVTKKKICKFFNQNRCKFGDRCFNIHPKQNVHQGRYIPPWKNDRPPQNFKYIRVPSQFPDPTLYNGYLTQNRFQPLPLMDLDLGEHSEYWSRPYNPQFNNSSNKFSNYAH